MYGNITQHIPRTNFKFAAVYPSRLALALDEKNYWNFSYHGEKEDYAIKNGAKPLHSIGVNEYVLINYNIPKQNSNNNQMPEVIFNSNQEDDLNNNNSFAYELNQDGSIKMDINNNPVPKSGLDENGNPTYDEYYTDLINYGGTFQSGNYHYTIWQKQYKVKNDNVKPTFVAIGRLHSIIPTFETWGSYNIDILEPLSSDPDAFGMGKEWYYPPKVIN